MPKELRKNPHCLNCGKVINESNFCPDCGQQNSTKQIPLHHFFHDFLGDYFTFDSKFFRSFIPLLKKPGHLTNEYNHGRRVSYIFPLRLYIFTTVLFFFIISINNKLTQQDFENTDLVVGKDSLRVVVEKYNDVIPPNIQRGLVEDIASRYKLTQKSEGKKSKYRDSLYVLLQDPKLNLSDTTQLILANDLSNYFKLRQKGTSPNQEYEVTYLGGILDDYPELKNNDKVGQVTELIDSNFKITPNYGYHPDGDDSKVNISFGDDLEEGFLKNQEDKLQRLLKTDQGGRIFWQEVFNQIPKVMFLILPIFALTLKLLYIRHKIFYINHLVFSLHAHTVIFLYLVFAILFPKWYVITGVVIGIWVHLFVAFLNVYKQSLIRTFLKLNTLLFIHFFSLLFGFIVLLLLAVISI